jgi:hypothetical protein
MRPTKSSALFAMAGRRQYRQGLSKKVSASQAQLELKMTSSMWAEFGQMKRRFVKATKFGDGL